MILDFKLEFWLIMIVSSLPLFSFVLTIFFGELIPCNVLCLLKSKFSVKRLLQVSDLAAKAGFQSSLKEK